jgi:protein-tyrosine phosphatase
VGSGWKTKSSAGVKLALTLWCPCCPAKKNTTSELVEEASMCRAQGIRFVGFPVVDRGVPSSLLEAVDLLKDLREDLHAGKTVVLHCRQGIGRSSLIAAALLVTAGIDPQAAFSAVGSARQLAVPETREQRLWVERLWSDHWALVRD